MRKLSLLFLLAACELQPAPPPQATAAAPAAPEPAPPAPPPRADAGATPGWSEGCRDAGIHIASVVINNTTDTAQRSIYEQDREKMVRAMADACTTQAWSDAAIKCYIAASTQPDLKECEKKFTPVPVPPPRPKFDENSAPLPPGRVPGAVPAGAGSGSGSAAGGAPKAAGTTPKAAGTTPKATGTTPKATGTTPPKAGTGSGSAAPRR